MRVKVDWRSSSKTNYKAFCKKHPTINISFDQWKKLLYGFNEYFKTYILETGDKARMPFGLGDFAITKKKRKKIKTNKEGREFINLPVDWKRTKEKGKIIYNFNFHTEGYFFGWVWFKNTARIRNTDLWYFKPSRVSSRLLSHYINTDKKYQHLYKQWRIF